MGKEKKKKKPLPAPSPNGEGSKMYFLLGSYWGISTRKNVQFVRKSLDDY